MKTNPILCSGRLWPLSVCVPRCNKTKLLRLYTPPAGCEPIRRAHQSLAKIGSSNCQVHPWAPAPGSASGRFPHDAGQHANFPLIESSLDFQPCSLFKSQPITAMLSNGPSLNLYKARFSGSVLLSQPTLKIKQAHSLATAKLRSRQSALLILPDNSCLLLRAEAPTRPPGLSILAFHAPELSQIPLASNSWPCLHGYTVASGSCRTNLAGSTSALSATVTSPAAAAKPCALSFDGDRR